QFRERGLRGHAVRADLSRREEREAAFHNAVGLLGGLDIMVNAAGIQRRYPCEEFPQEEWDRVLEVNLTAPFHLSQMAAREFLKKELPYGKIINVASLMSFFGGFTIPAYAASKGGVVQFSKGMCNELAGRGININCIAPGYMDTELNTALTADPRNPRYQSITARIPAHRWGGPEDMKGIAIFLASHASDYVNGAVIPVDGGYLVC
ncbi:MAG: SDR family oxidoreductase, partial [Oscillospiraceae bacterium]|nr:SDR family oxidoreductase [Oscillospiraceae bacterium]